MPDEPQTTGTCHLCEVNSTTNEDFCYGCNESICSDCSVNFELPFGGHDPEDHQYDPLEPDEDDDDC